MDWRQQFRVAFTPGMFLGITFGDWFHFLRENRYPVEAPYWGRAASITVNSLLNSFFRWREELVYGAAVRAVKIPPPVFILGHWRSGTTHLHNLLSQDHRFAYPNVYQVNFPHTFLSTEETFAPYLAGLIPPKRPTDNMALRLDMPAEDELATCIQSFRSPYLHFVCPNRIAEFDRYYTFRDVPKTEVAQWKEALTQFLQKLTWKFGRPLILKSPPHTCRIRLLLEMFPGARFVHLHRNPYTVFQSTRQMHELALRSFGLQQWRTNLNAAILEVYHSMYDVFFAERGLIPSGSFHEIGFEDLERDPVGELRRLYDALHLPDFGPAETRVRQYLGSLAAYQKNDYPALTGALRSQISRTWRRCFEEWQFPR